MLIAADRLTTLPYRRWSPWVAGFACVLLSVGGGLAIRDAARLFNGGGSWGGPAAVGVVAALAAAVGLVQTVRHAPAARRGEPIGVSLLGIGLATLPLAAVSIPFTVFLLIAVLVVFEIARQREVFRARLLTVLSACSETGQRPLRLIDSLLDARFARFVLRKRLEALAAHLSRGLTLVDALDASRILRGDQIAALRAASASGSLPEELVRQAAQSKARGGRRPGARLTQAAAYACLLSFMLFSVMGFVMYWIVPKMKEIFWDFGVELPRSTQRLIDGDFYLPTMTAAAVLVACVVVSAGLLYFTPYSAPEWLRRLLPRRAVAAEVLRTLAVPVRSGRPIEPVVEMLGLKTASEYWQDLWGGVAGSLGNGVPLGMALHEQQLLRKADAAIIDTADRRGIGAALESVADRVRTRQNAAITAFGHAAAFLLFLIVSFVVAVCVIGLMTPIIKLIAELS